MTRDIDFTQPLSEDDAQYVSERPWLAQDAQLQGIEVRYESDEAAPAEDDEELDEQEETTDEVDYSGYKVAELRGFLEQRGLDTDGNKTELIARLHESDSEEAEPEDEDEAEDEPAE